MTRDETVMLLSELVKHAPYDCTRETLYSSQSLYDGYRVGEPDSYRDSYDGRVYQHYINAGKGYEADEIEQVMRVLHDSAISCAMRTFLSYIPRCSVVGIMGGHSLARTSEDYVQVARIARRLTENGALMISGGGPGAMEATHLGAWMAGRTDAEFDEAVSVMSYAPTYSDDGWLDTQFEVMERFPQTTYKSLGLPTWLYGHEPPTPLATHIAKFFDNSIREDAILTIAYGGLVFAPGSAGTLQEMFQDAVQNHYLSLGISSPMVFFGKKFWTEEVPVYTLMQFLMKNGHYKNLRLSISDDSDEIVAILEAFREEARHFDD